MKNHSIDKMRKILFEDYKKCIKSNIYCDQCDDKRERTRVVYYSDGVHAKITKEIEGMGKNCIECSICHHIIGEHI